MQTAKEEEGSGRRRRRQRGEKIKVYPRNYVCCLTKLWVSISPAISTIPAKYQVVCSQLGQADNVNGDQRRVGKEGGRGEKARAAWSKTSTSALLQVSVVGEGQTYWSILQVQLKSEDM